MTSHHARQIAVTLMIACHHIGSLGAQEPRSTQLGAPTAKPAEAFTKLTGAVELTPTTVLVADETERRLAIIDLRTGAARTIGRVGSGPGEFRTIGRLITRPGGGAYLVDFGLRRVLPITSDGTFENTVAFPAMSLQVRGIDARGNMYGDSFLPRQGNTLPDSMWILRWDLASARIDTVMKYNANVDAMITSPGEAYHPFSPRDAWGVLPSGDIAIVNAAEYRATLWHDGRMTRATPIPWTPIRVTEAEKSAFNRELAQSPARSLGQGGAAPSSRPRMEVEFPATMAPFETENVTMSPDGRLWIERMRAATDSASRYDVVDGTSGQLLARLALSPRSTVVGFARGTVYIGERDADDVMYLRRYAVPAWPSR